MAFFFFFLLSSSSFRCERVHLINAPVALLGYLGFVSRLGLQLEQAVFGDVNLQLLIEYDALLGEVEAGPELAGSERGYDVANEAIFQHIAGAQRGHADVLLVVVGIDRRIRKSEVLDGRLLGVDHGAVGLAHADVSYFQFVIQRAVTDLDLTQRLHAALADDLDLRFRREASGAVVLKANGLPEMLHHVRFLGIVGSGGRLGGRGFFARGRWRGILGRGSLCGAVGLRSGRGGRRLLCQGRSERENKQENSGEG